MLYDNSNPEKSVASWILEQTKIDILWFVIKTS